MTVKEYLLQLGYSIEDVGNILNSYPLCNLKESFYNTLGSLNEIITTI